MSDHLCIKKKKHYWKGLVLELLQTCRSSEIHSVDLKVPDVL